MDQGTALGSPKHHHLPEKLVQQPYLKVIIKYYPFSLIISKKMKTHTNLIVGYPVIEILIDSIQVYRCLLRILTANSQFKLFTEQNNITRHCDVFLQINFNQISLINEWRFITKIEQNNLIESFFRRFVLFLCLPVFDVVYKILQ